MEPLDLRTTPLRGPRETLLGVTFLPRTIDKARAQQPGGNLDGYVDRPDGMSAILLKMLKLDRDEFYGVIASASTEDDVVAWVSEHADLHDVAKLNAKLESLEIGKLPPEFAARARAAHPVLETQPELTRFYDIFEADDATHPSLTRS